MNINNYFRLYDFTHIIKFIVRILSFVCRHNQYNLKVGILVTVKYSVRFGCLSTARFIAVEN